MNSTMEKKPEKKTNKPKPSLPKEEDNIPESGPYQYPLRFADACLARRVAARAKRLRRSFNQQILFMLEESMGREAD